MLMTKLKTISTGLLVAAALAGGAGVLAQQHVKSAAAHRPFADFAGAPTGGAKEPAGATSDPAARLDTRELVERLDAEAAAQRNQLQATLSQLQAAKVALQTQRAAEATSRPPAELDAPRRDDLAAGLAARLGNKPETDDLPSDQEIMKSLIETRFKNLRLDVEKVKSEIQPCRVYPLAGPCQSVKTQYKCTVQFDELHGDRLEREVNVVYLDKVRLVPCTDSGHSHLTENHSAAGEPAAPEIARRVEQTEQLFKRGYVPSPAEAERAKLQSLSKLLIAVHSSAIVPDRHRHLDIDPEQCNTATRSGAQVPRRGAQADEIPGADAMRGTRVGHSGCRRHQAIAKRCLATILFLQQVSPRRATARSRTRPSFVCRSRSARPDHRALTGSSSAQSRSFLAHQGAGLRGVGELAVRAFAMQRSNVRTARPSKPAATTTLTAMQSQTDPSFRAGLA